MNDFNTKIEELNKIKNNCRRQENSIEQDLWTRADAQVDLLRIQRAEAVEEAKEMQIEIEVIPKMCLNNPNEACDDCQIQMMKLNKVIDYLKQKFNIEESEINV